MPLTNCPRCKQLFNKIRIPVCPACEGDEEADLEKVRASLHSQPNQTAEEVAESTGVDLDCVLRLVDEGHIANVGILESIKCGRCGAPAISATKRLCQDCLNRLSTDLAAEQAKIVLPPKRVIEPIREKSVHQTVDEKRR